MRRLLQLSGSFLSQSMRKCHSADGSSILTRSSIVLQDGPDISEQPLVIRRIGAGDFPFTNGPTSYANSTQETPDIKQFHTQLHSCVTIPQVLRMLEIPGEQVTSSTAGLALQRIHQLQQAHTEDEQRSFIRQAVLNELCETVVKDVSSLPASVICALLRCSLHSKDYDQGFVQNLYQSIETRIGDSVLTIPQICELLDVLSVYPNAQQNVANNLWIHLGNRYKEVQQENIRLVYDTMRFVSPEYKYLFRVMDKSLKRCWWKLQGRDVSAIVRMITLCNHYSASTLVMFTNWLFTNIHDVTDEQLKDILGAFDQFKFSDPQIIRALERYVHAKVSRMDKPLIGMTMEFFRSRRFLSPRVFDAVATHFQNHGHEFEAREVLKILRPYGQLNYLPPNVTQLFLKVEEVLRLRFSEFDAATIAELLASFVYIERFPVNFLKKIFTPHFLGMCISIPNQELRQKTARHLLELQAAINLEVPHHATSIMDWDTLGLSLTGLGQRYVKFHQDVRAVLMEMFGPDKVNQVEIPRNTPHLIDFEICVNSMRVPVICGRGNTKNRLAIIGLLPEYYCVNTSHLLGEHIMRKRHLAKLGYTVIELHFEVFMWTHKRGSSKVTYIMDILSPHVKFT